MDRIPVNLILLIIKQLLKVISPELRKLIEEWINNLEEQASQTPNPWDNILVGFLKVLLDVE